MRHKWTTELDEFIRDKIAEKYSFSVIANFIWEQFGHAYSRNAVIGRAARIGIRTPPRTTHRRTIRDWAKLKSAASELPRPSRPRIRKPWAPPVKPVHPVNLEDVSCPEPLNVTLFDISQYQCRWVTAGPRQVTYCGHDVYRKTSWCPYHYKITHEFKPRKPLKPAPETNKPTFFHGADGTFKEAAA